jgi:hypothetical protein
MNHTRHYLDAPSFTGRTASHWSRRRIAVEGDAACCVSPLAGRGTSLAVAGAHVLALLPSHVSRHRREMTPASICEVPTLPSHASWLDARLARGRSCGYGSVRREVPSSVVVKCVVECCTTPRRPYTSPINGIPRSLPRPSAHR